MVEFHATELWLSLILDIGWRKRANVPNLISTSVIPPCMFYSAWDDGYQRSFIRHNKWKLMTLTKTWGLMKSWRSSSTWHEPQTIGILSQIRMILPVKTCKAPHVLHNPCRNAPKSVDIDQESVIIEECEEERPILSAWATRRNSRAESRSSSLRYGSKCRHARTHRVLESILVLWPTPKPTNIDYRWGLARFTSPLSIYSCNLQISLKAVESTCRLWSRKECPTVCHGPPGWAYPRRANLVQCVSENRDSRFRKSSWEPCHTVRQSGKNGCYPRSKRLSISKSRTCLYVGSTMYWTAYLGMKQASTLLTRPMWATWTWFEYTRDTHTFSELGVLEWSIRNCPRQSYQAVEVAAWRNCSYDKGMHL